eukprot:TRINITY_DN8246_c0_g1_i3.p1 TRINITY_DN8246_c0_g1~~TRINITY_DN8246_c0_g1_i3.p1  ORF type:complete len:105 (+),score=11.81 TRINITY_DN8246_c0_g1_i3:61-375(+)
MCHSISELIYFQHPNPGRVLTSLSCVLVVYTGITDSLSQGAAWLLTLDVMIMPNSCNTHQMYVLLAMFTSTQFCCEPDIKMSSSHKSPEKDHDAETLDSVQQSP